MKGALPDPQSIFATADKTNKTKRNILKLMMFFGPLTLQFASLFFKKISQIEYQIPYPIAISSINQRFTLENSLKKERLIRVRTCVCKSINLIEERERGLDDRESYEKARVQIQ